MSAEIDPEQWSDRVLPDEPKMFVGRRKPNRTIEAHQVSLLDATYGTLRDICQDALDTVASMTPIAPEPYAHPELGEEYLYVPLDDSTVDGTDIHVLPDLCLNLDDVPYAGAQDIRELQLQFYGIAFGTGDDLIAFIRKSNPRAALQRGKRFFKFSDYLEPAEQPDVMLDEEIDIIVTPRGMSVLKPFAFETLATGVTFSTEHIRGYVHDFEAGLTGKLTLAAASVTTLLEVAVRKVSIAKRLREAGKASAKLDIDLASLKEKMTHHGVPEKFLLDTNGEVVLDEATVLPFLDLIEGRFFYQDFTNAPVRADRFRTRAPLPSGEH